MQTTLQPDAPGANLSPDFVQAFSTVANPDSWASRNHHLFPTETSFRWFLRRHRNRLTDAGALVRIGGRWFVDMSKWPAAFAECIRRDTLGAPQPCEGVAA